jgi:hypothetical protein
LQAVRHQPAPNTAPLCSGQDRNLVHFPAAHAIQAGRKEAVQIAKGLTFCTGNQDDMPWKLENGLKLRDVYRLVRPDSRLDPRQVGYIR